MRKELLIAIVLGLFFGLTIGFGIWRANNAISKDQVSTEASSPESTDIATTTPSNSLGNGTPTQNAGFIISNPSDFDVSTTSTVWIKGLTAAMGKVVVSAENNDYLAVATEKGDFEVEVNLVEGLNQIVIKELDSNSEQKIIKVIYTKSLN